MAKSVAVTAGLKSGEIVVTEGGDRLRDGAQVLLPGSRHRPRPARQAPASPARRERRAHRARTEPARTPNRRNDPDASVLAAAVAHAVARA